MNPNPWNTLSFLKKKKRKRKKGLIATGMMTKKTLLHCVIPSNTLVLFYCRIVCFASCPPNPNHLFGCFCNFSQATVTNLSTEILPQFIKREADMFLDVLSLLHWYFLFKYNPWELNKLPCDSVWQFIDRMSTEVEPAVFRVRLVNSCGNICKGVANNVW